jgi:hypothetical protein
MLIEHIQQKPIIVGTIAAVELIAWEGSVLPQVGQ